MDDITFQNIVINKLEKLDRKIEDQHKRIDIIAQELVRIDTELKIEEKIESGYEDKSNFNRELAIGIIGALGVVFGIIMAVV